MKSKPQLKGNSLFFSLASFNREERFAFGHHYFRPHETHHSPSRRFYHNELFRVPLYEIIPLEAVVGTCCVLDLYTYCKGKQALLGEKINTLGIVFLHLQ